MEGTEAQVVFRLPSVRGFVAQHSTHLTDEQLRRLTLSAETEVPDIVHELSVNVDKLEYIAPPYCISEHDGCKQPSQQYTANQQLACLIFLHRHTQALTTQFCNAGGVVDDRSNK